MGLLFQPRRTKPNATAKQIAPHPNDASPDHETVFRAALEAVVLGDASHFEDLFTDDVTFTSPHLALASRAAVQLALGVPEDSLSDVAIRIAESMTTSPSLDDAGAAASGHRRHQAHAESTNERTRHDRS